VAFYWALAFYRQNIGKLVVAPKAAQESKRVFSAKIKKAGPKFLKKKYSGVAPTILATIS